MIANALFPMLLAAAVLGVAMAEDASKKRLVLFAGPHRSGSASVEEFFQRYCKGAVKGDKESFALRFWKWPVVSQEHAKPGVPPYKVFQNLVLEPSMKDPLNVDILAGIKDAYETTQDGIILGTELFDQMGAYSEYDGMAAMKRIVDHVGLTNDPAMVTVIVNYRAPRFEHWESVWKGSVEGTNRTYKDFMCHTRQYHEKIELLSTAANPLQIALESQKQGWNVALMDMQGIEENNLDVAHTIACNVMDAKCQQSDGWVNNHADESIHNNEAEDGHSVFELTDEQRLKAEELLLARDCGYGAMMKELETSGIADFVVHYESSLWKNCDPNLSSSVYANLLNPELVFRGLLSQLKCGNVIYDDMPKSIDDILSGKFTLGKHSTSVSSSGKVSHKKKNHHMFFWLFALVGLYVGMSIYKNNGRVPAAWLVSANNLRLGAQEMITRGKLRVSSIQLETVDRGQPSTSLSGQFA
ncbi:hypothetical protein IV203_017003 [Nitzschia inconspicua]|uniref:Uncharacterized protein n=1 Tax=Nitzschia inconspicua TaxID=303405 RepID=A0A9K3PI71_9STRA|nr:hypothetical protein IV203_017003 [Nitzschia inconspicua]